MRRIVLLAATYLIATPVFAQNSAVQSARNYLREKDFENAIKYINQALEDPSTKDKPKTWYAKGDIYLQMSEDANYKKTSPDPVQEATKAYMKVVELDPEYEKEDINAKLLRSAIVYYNDGVNNYNASKYEEAYNGLQNVISIQRLEGGKRFSKNKNVDTLLVSSKQMMGYSAFYQKKYDVALPLLNDLKGSPITKNASLYLALAEIYSSQGKKDEQLAALQEGRKAFPDEANLRAEEINFYIAANRTDELTRKLEDAIIADPNNAELHYTLANILNNMANPKQGGKPANAKELIGKAEEGYKKALAIEPNSGEYNFNYSVLYYMQAYDIAAQMNTLGESASDMKKYEALNKDRIDMLNKALPFAEKSYAIYEPKASTLNARDKEIYNNTLKELFEIYAKLNQTDKAAEIKKKMDANK